MLLRLRNSLASMRAMVREQERVANNLANANTVGYKRDRTFTEALDEYLDEEGAPQLHLFTDRPKALAGLAYEGDPEAPPIQLHLLKRVRMGERNAWFHAELN